MQQSPPPWSPAPITTTPPRERGCLLTVILLFGMFGNVISAGFMFIQAKATSLAAADDIDGSATGIARAASRYFTFLALLSLCNAGSATGMWMWKKWGVYGYGFCSALGAIIGFKIAPASAIGSLLGNGIVVAILASKWRYFE
jgi:hypothetical protein